MNVYHDVHEMGIFTRATWLRPLTEAGFEPHRVVGADGLDIFIGVSRDQARDPATEATRTARSR